MSQIQYLSVVRDLSFLPKLIGVRCLWKELQLSLVAELLSVTLDRFHALINNPRLLQTEQQECYTAGRQLVEYRLSVQQDLPTRLRHVCSWNLNSWKTPSTASDDPKTRRCRRLQGRPRIAKPRMMKENGAKKRTAHTGSFRQQTQRTRGDAKKQCCEIVSAILKNPCSRENPLSPLDSYHTTPW